MMDFKKFIESDPKYKKFIENETAESLFNYMLEPVNIDKMIMANTNGRPALEGILPEIEENFNSDDFDIEKDNFTRQFIGVMVREIIKDFGYIVDRAELSRQKNIKSKFITSATHYRYVPDLAKKRIKKEISIVNIQKEGFFHE